MEQKIKRFDYTVKVGRAGRRLQEDYTLCDGKRHYQITVCCSSRGGTNVVHACRFCDKSRCREREMITADGEVRSAVEEIAEDGARCQVVEEIAIDGLPQKVRDLLIVSVPAGCLAIIFPAIADKVAAKKSGEAITSRVYGQGAAIRHGDLRRAVVLEDDRHIGVPETSPSGRQTITLVYNARGRICLFSGVDNPEKRSLIKKRIELIRLGFSPQKAGKAVPITAMSAT